LDSTDVVLYCSSSAVIEAIQRDKLAIRVAWDDLWDSNPIRSETTSIPICNTPSELQKLLTEITLMPLLDLKNLKRKQRILADSIYSKFEPILLDKLILYVH
jgi:hypothetical protein